MAKKTYKITVTTKGNTMHIARENDGFDFFELLGVLQNTIDDLNERNKNKLLDNTNPVLSINYSDHNETYRWFNNNYRFSK